MDTGGAKGQQQSDNPYDNAGVVSKIFFWWLRPLLFKGHRGSIQLEDVFRAPRGDGSARLCDSLLAEWERELDGGECSKGPGRKYKRKREPSLHKALVRAFGWEVLVLGAVTFLEEIVIKMLQPVLLSWFIGYFTDTNTEVTERGAFLLGSGLLFLSASFAAAHPLYHFTAQRKGMRIRIALSALVYRKALRLSSAALEKTPVGQMVNLLSNDVSKFEMAFLYFHNIWSGPLQMLVVIALTWKRVGPATLAGTAVILLTLPLQGTLGRKASKLRAATAKKTDDRLQIMSEIIHAIKAIKIYAWEFLFADLVANARRKEIDRVTKTSLLRAVNNVLYYCATGLLYLNVLAAYVLSGNVLLPGPTFLVLTIYQALRVSMAFFFPMALLMLAEAHVSVKRIQEFLLNAELSRKPEPKFHEDSDVMIWFKEVTAKWSDKESKPDLIKGVTFKVKKGELCAIIGPVGSGKSTLLNCILRETHFTSGKMQVAGSLSYACQEPWLFSGTVRQNILFGQPFDEERYNKVLELCGLLHDLSLWEQWDQTLVGERGKQLSGGQKARVNLARAIYKEADVYLLDDPLSAVDAQVGRQLFDTCIKGFLGGRTVVLVTHQLQYLARADKILVVSGGRLEATGSYVDILASGTDLSEFMEKEEEEEDDGLWEEMNDSDKEERQTLTNGDSGSEKSTPSSAGASLVSQEKVTAKVYKNYLMAGNGWLITLVYATFYVGTQVAQTVSEVWIGKWSDKGAQSLKQQKENSTTEHEHPDSTDWYYLSVYGVMVVLMVAFCFGRGTIFFWSRMRSSRALHDQMFAKIIRTPSKFFDANPAGRILNRFAKDLGAVDEQLPMAMASTFDITLVVAASILVNVYNIPIVSAPAVIILVAFAYARRFYLATSRPVKRLEGMTKSPVFSHLSSTIHGLTTVRALGAEEALTAQFDHLQDVHTSTFFGYLSAAYWFGSVSEWIAFVFLASCVYGFLAFRDSVRGGDVGVSLKHGILLTTLMRSWMKFLTDTENNMVSAERVMEYAHIDTEEGPDEPNKRKANDDWPSLGVVEFRDVWLTYDEGETYVLKGINFITNPSEKRLLTYVGIVGRTGAGKSSITSVLFRLYEAAQGEVTVDGVATSDLHLGDLRRSMSLIPQDPLLFSGTFRKNLDPFGEFLDADIWSALLNVHEDPAVFGIRPRSGLDGRVADGGRNLSVGQKQLICLARATLRNSKILVLDEATANVDPRTDQCIQNAIRMNFEDCTVLTVAHRLHTVMDCDRIVVIADGAIQESASPHLLLRDPNSALTHMARHADRGTQRSLVDMAEAAFRRRMEKLHSRSES